MQPLEEFLRESTSSVKKSHTNSSALSFWQRFGALYRKARKETASRDVFEELFSSSSSSCTSSSQSSGAVSDDISDGISDGEKGGTGIGTIHEKVLKLLLGTVDRARVLRRQGLDYLEKMVGKFFLIVFDH